MNGTKLGAIAPQMNSSSYYPSTSSATSTQNKIRAVGNANRKKRLNKSKINLGPTPKVVGHQIDSIATKMPELSSGMRSSMGNMPRLKLGGA